MGVSGTVLFVPFYTMVFPLLGRHLEPVQAVEVGLLTEIFGFMSSVSAFWRAGLIDFQIAGFAVMVAAPTAILGGYVSHFLPGNWLLAVIGVALLIFSFLLVRETTDNVPHAESEVSGPKIKQHRDRIGRTYRYKILNDGWRGSAAGFGGILQGLVGFSAGELSTVEQVLRGMPVRMAAGNSHLIIFAASISAAATHMAVGAATGNKIPWNLVAMTIPAVLIGGQTAALVAGRIPQHTMRLVLACFLTFIGSLSAYRALQGAGIHIPAWVLWTTILLCLGSIILFIRRRSRMAAGQVACETAAGGCCASCAPEKSEASN